MTRYPLYISLVIAFWSLCSSCTHQYYAPSDAMLLGIHEKGDIRGHGGIGTNFGEGNQKFNCNIAAGYSPFDQVAVMANFFHLKNQSGTIAGQGFSSEIAVGLYKILRQSPVPKLLGNNGIEPKDAPYYYQEKNYPRKMLVGDIYAGYGYGKVTNHYGGVEAGISTLSFNKYFLQSALHIKYKKLMTTSLGLKFVRLDYQKGLLLGSVSERETDSIRNISRHNPYSFCELLAKMEIGPPRTKFFWQVTIATKFDDRAPLNYVPIVLSTGMTLDF